MTGIAVACIVVVLARGRFRSAPSGAADAPVACAAIRTNLFEHVIAEDVRLYRPEGGSFPLVSVGLCRLGKPRVGGFRLGVGNVLELERLEVNVPLDAQAVVTNTAEKIISTDTPPGALLSVDQILQRTIDLASLRRLAGASTRLSGVSLHDLHIYMVRGTTRIVVLTAVDGQLSGRGMALKKCVFLDESLRQVTAAEARLVNEHGWRIVAADGATAVMGNVAAALRGRGP